MLRKVVKICVKKKVNLHAEKSLSFRWLKVLDDVKLWELAENKKKKIAKWGGGRGIEQRSPVRAVVKAASVCFC